jgi:hypothetical protein
MRWIGKKETRFFPYLACFTKTLTFVLQFLERGEQKIIKDEREPNVNANAQSTLEINFRADFPAIFPEVKYSFFPGTMK